MPKSDSVTCLETGTVLTDPQQAYKHAIHVFHLEDRGAKQILKDMERHSNPEYAKRVSVLMRYALGKEE